MAQLPPKIPNQNWPPTIPPNQRMPPLTTTSPPPQQPPPPQPSPTAAASLWADEFLDFSSARRGHHRRSMSDSIAFLESPLIDACRNSLHAGASGFDRLDDEQLMSMFSDDVSGGRDSNNGMVGSPSDQNSNNDENVMSAEYNDGHNGDGDGDGDGERSHWLPKTEVGEVESDCNNNNNNSLSAPSSGNVTPIYSDADPTCFDPKRVKRILANRQSAQRSRVRKLQYISELERSVTSLQTEVSALSPRVAYLDHQRLILNVDNSAIKQRIAALAQDKIFKDAHQEALKKEIERLSQIYHQQQQQQHQQHQQTMKLMGNTATQPPSSDHSMDCADKEQLMA